MRSILKFSIFAIICSAACLAQVWEIGGATGTGFVKGVNAAGSSGSATAGFQPGFALSVVAGQNLYQRLSGELRYTYLQSNLKLSAGGTDTTFGGAAHAVHYDFVWHFARRRSKIYPFVAAGAGIKLFRGTGNESAYQPLNQFAYLTHTQQVEPLLSGGGGIRVPLKPNVFLRVEVRDQITPFPSRVIAAAPGTNIHGWLHDFVPLIGISYTFGE
jgi:hypothetical protein